MKQWFNEEKNICQSQDPAEGCYGSLIEERRKGWVEKDIDFRPPELPPVETNETILAKISVIESKQSRSVREFILGDELAKDRLVKMDEEISILRKKLK